MGSLIVQEPLPPYIKNYLVHDNDGDEDALGPEYHDGIAVVHRGGGDKSDLVMYVESTEANGQIKMVEMACPPAPLLSKASKKLKRLLASAKKENQRPTVQGKEGRSHLSNALFLFLCSSFWPLSSGNYRVWEEIMSHIAQPSSFTQSRYKPDLLMEMMAVAHT